MQKKTTSYDIINQIADSKSPDIINSDLVQSVSFGDLIREDLKERKLNKAKLLDAICVERSYGYQILNGRRVPPRLVILRIALFLGLGVERTQLLLNAGQKEGLFPTSRFDAVVIYALGHNYDMHRTEELLEEFQQPSLFEE